MKVRSKGLICESIMGHESRSGLRYAPRVFIKTLEECAIISIRWRISRDARLRGLIVVPEERHRRSGLLNARVNNDRKKEEVADNASQ